MNKILELAERMACEAGVSRRGFLGLVGRRAVAVVAALGALLAAPGRAQAGPKPCTTNDDCAKGEFCLKADGDCDGDGYCQQRPDFCTEEYNPVCGCDTHTYSNRCHAYGAGVSVAYAGKCN